MLQGTCIKCGEIYETSREDDSLIDLVIFHIHPHHKLTRVLCLGSNKPTIEAIVAFDHLYLAYVKDYLTNHGIALAKHLETRLDVVQWIRYQVARGK